MLKKAYIQFADIGHVCFKKVSGQTAIAGSSSERR